MTHIKELAKNAISVEISELISYEERIDERFEKSRYYLPPTFEKLIIVGVGKSAHVANKIVATL